MWSSKKTPKMCVDTCIAGRLARMHKARRHSAVIVTRQSKSTVMQYYMYVVKVIDVSITRRGSSRSGDRPSGRVGSGLVIAL